jgi:hypothetical protein
MILRICSTDDVAQNTVMEVIRIRVWLKNVDTYLTLTPESRLTGLNFTMKIFDPVSDMLTVN